MDGFQPHDNLDHDMEVAMDVPPLVQFDERRMHVRAYNYWATLLGDRKFPSIEDLEPAEIEDFGAHSVLLDFTGGMENPVIAFLGSALARECGVSDTPDTIDDVPSRTLLSRLTDHYLQIIANEAPVGFEAEFTNQRGDEVLYRGILMPFSTDDDTIDFVYGVINWKEVASDVITADIARAVGAIGAEPAPAPAAPAAVPGEDWSGQAAALEALFEMPELSLDGFAETHEDSLSEGLETARRAAAEAFAAEGRGRQALYRAIGLAHGFAIIARARPDDYAAMLVEAEIVAQPRSPMTALVKLVFGVDYDKTRLSEFAVAIEHGLSAGIEDGVFADHLTAYPGGLKAYVRDARAARRSPATPPKSRAAAARARLSAAPAVALDAIATDTDGLAVVVVRRLADGSLDAVGGIAGDDKRVASILQAVARGV